MAARYPEELEWARALARGEASAWERFTAEVGPVVLAAVRRDLGPASGVSPEQVHQELCFRLCEDGYRRLRTFRGESRLRTWAAVLAVRLGRGLLARQRAHGAAERAQGERHPLAGDPVLGLAEKEAVAIAVASLPARVQLLLRLVYWDGATLSEASAVMGIPANTLSPMLTEAREALRRILAGEGAEKA